MSTENSPERSNAGAPQRLPVALIAGPTASGKSDCAVRLALASEKRGRRAVVINADSAQVYADLMVLSARPRAEEMQGIEHRLFGTWDAGLACSAADWANTARAQIAEVLAAGGLPVLVGGTGLYIRTLLDGIAPVPPIDLAVRADVRAMDPGDAWAALQREDPGRAAALSANDRTRIIRALEVVRSTGRPLAHWQGKRTGGIIDEIDLRAVILLPERQWLYPRCDARFAAMLESGAIPEVEALLARQLDPALPAMRAIGVPEIAAYLRGDCTLDEVRARGSQATRNYAKRQFTWLRHQLSAQWPRVPPEHFVNEDNFDILL
jgi:tRNA dimethylallyltransferase